MSRAALEKGVANMLFDCGAAKPGERVLILHEPLTETHYDTEIVRAVFDTAARHGLRPKLAEVPFDPGATQIPQPILEQMSAADLTVFLARLGDQLRFKDFPRGTRALISYALDVRTLASPFGTAPHAAFKRLKSCINSALTSAERIRLTCPRGTDIKGKITADPSELEDVGLSRFPMSVFRPVPAAGFSGRAALCGFLTGTGSMYYEPFSCFFDGPVHALLRDGRLTGFDGAPEDVARANAHYDRVAAEYGIDRNFVHSWHAGLHPGCAHPTPARANMVQWSGSAFGNPRLLHFHTCGAYAPGEISWNMLDPTITLDAVAVWENGHLYPERLPGGAEILAEFPEVAEIFAHPDMRIGL